MKRKLFLLPGGSTGDWESISSKPWLTQ
jgi:hypothetical protein